MRLHEEEPEQWPLPLVIDDEVMGINYGGATDLAVALHRVVDIDNSNEPALKMSHTQTTKHSPQQGKVVKSC